MILGSKPISEMSKDELHAAIEELRSNREALRSEAVKKKQAREAGEIVPKEPKAPRVAKKPDVAVQQALKDLMGG